MLNEAVTTDVARVLAELVDTALADDWNEDLPTMALLWESSEDPDDLRIAVRRLEASVEDELAPLGELGPYLAVAHSTVTCQPPAEVLGHSDGAPIRLTVAVDHRSETGVLRHRNGATEWFGPVDLPIIELLRAGLQFES
ncbi:MAG: hypothetical protein LC792_12660 [Actinobacteria bacterium]|nr:hypothetical protein [Actinomycetota bacterium]